MRAIVIGHTGMTSISTLVSKARQVGLALIDPRKALRSAVEVAPLSQQYFEGVSMEEYQPTHHPADIYRHKSKTFQKNRRKALKKSRRRRQKR